MARPRKVPGLRAGHTLQENARRIATVRLAELYGFAHAVHHPSQDAELHSMRIAAKRLRYTLEIFRVCYGPDIEDRIDDVKEIQEQIGQIHDCDVLTGMLRRHLAVLAQREQEHLATLASARQSHETRMTSIHDAIQSSIEQDPRLGILALLGRTLDDREQRYRSFVRWWDEHQAAGMHGTLYACITADPVQEEKEPA